MTQNYLTRFAAFCLLILLGAPLHAQVGVSAAATVPNPRAMLELTSTTKGLLIPRMPESGRTSIPLPIPNGLMVYQTNTNGVASPEGYWYYDATVPAWLPLQTSGTHWSTTGNAITGVEYVGTTDARDFSLRTNNVERVVMEQAAGHMRIPGTAPNTEMLNINGALMVNGTAAAPEQKGDIRWNAALSAHEGNIDASTTWYQLENIFQKRTGQPYDSTAIGNCVSTPNPWVQIGNTGGITLGSTIETPYSTLWEDGRHQYLWLASEIQAAGICPGYDFTGLAFHVPAGGLGGAPQYVMPLVEIKMKNTVTASMTNFDYTGLSTVYTTPSFTPVANNWNYHGPFIAGAFQWDGVRNVLVEYCFNNYDWSWNTLVSAQTTTFSSLYGLYCDACGGPPGAPPCLPTVPPVPGCPGVNGVMPGNNWNGLGTGPCGVTGGSGCIGPAASQRCFGYSPQGGCAHTTTNSLLTCDGSFGWIGAYGNALRRPIIRFYVPHGTGPVTSTYNADYLYSGRSVMIGTPAWAAGAAPYTFKGPGTISAQVAVWGGTTMLSDYVFDHYYDGQVRPEDQHGAAFKHVPLDEMVNYVERERHLPTIDGRDAWQKNGTPSLDHLTNQLWVTVEEQALYIKELNERMELLQKYLIQQRLNALKD